MDNISPNPFTKHICSLNLRPYVVNATSGDSQSHDPGYPTETIYSDKAMWICCWVGGPLVAGYIIARNFETFNERKRVGWTWIVTIVVSLFIFAIAYAIADVNLAAMKAINGIYAGIAYLIIRYCQGKRIDAHIQAGGATHGHGHVLGISFAGLIITLLPLLIVLAGTAESTKPSRNYAVQLVDSPPPIPNVERPMLKTYGAPKHDVYFLESNISVEEIDKVVAVMTKTGFMAKPKKLFYIEKGIDTYEIYLSCNSKVTTEPNVYEAFSQIRKALQKRFPRDKIVFNLFVDRIDNVQMRVE